jgi:hypothetical protein
MNKEELLKKIEETQASVKQMVQDDYDENPETAVEEFQCDCCGEIKLFAGSLLYEEYRLCNDCVLIAEVSFALNKINNIQELMDSMEDKRFESLYNELFNKQELQENINN